MCPVSTARCSFVRGECGNTLWTCLLVHEEKGVGSKSVICYQDLLGARSKRVTDPVRLGFPQVPSHGLWVTDGYHLIQFSLALCCPSPIKWVVYWNRGVRETGWGRLVQCWLWSHRLGQSNLPYLLSFLGNKDNKSACLSGMLWRLNEIISVRA